MLAHPLRDVAVMRPWRTWLTVVLTLLAMSTTVEAHADEVDGSAISPRGWVRAIGLGTFSAVYATCLVVGYVGLEQDNEPLAPLMIPIVGPLVTTATTEMAPEGDALMYALSGLQVAGLLVLGLSFVGDDDASPSPELTFAPQLSPSVAGMQMGLTF